MQEPSEPTLDELLEQARRLNVLDGWEIVNGTVIFHLATRSIAIRREFAKTFVRGLLQGFERAARLEAEASSRTRRREE